MLIDWFTVGAQALNFIVLVFLMRHFLYKPVLNAIDAREKKIAAELGDAATKKAEAEKQRDAFQHKNDDFEAQRAALLKKATDDANKERDRLLGEARKAADLASDVRQKALKADAEQLNQAIGRRTQDEVFAIARKTLADLASTSLEEQIVGVFVRRMGALDGAAKATLAEAAKKTPDAVVVRSAFDLPAAERATVQDTVNRAFSADVHTRFDTAPDLVGGIELTTNGQKLGWSITEYLGALKKGIGELLQEHEKVAAKADGKVEPAPKVAAKPASKPEPNGKAATEAKSP